MTTFPAIAGSNFGGDPFPQPINGAFPYWGSSLEQLAHLTYCWHTSKPSIDFFGAHAQNIGIESIPLKMERKVHPCNHLSTCFSLKTLDHRFKTVFGDTRNRVSQRNFGPGYFDRFGVLGGHGDPWVSASAHWKGGIYPTGCPHMFQ